MDQNIYWLKKFGVSSPYAVAMMPYERDEQGNIPNQIDCAKLILDKI